MPRLNIKLLEQLLDREAAIHQAIQNEQNPERLLRLLGLQSRLLDRIEQAISTRTYMETEIKMSTNKIQYP